MYTDGSASSKNGVTKAGCGVWFADDSPFNISTGLKGRQTNNRAEMTAAILALRQAQKWPTLYKQVTLFSDSKLCVDAVNIWLSRWRIDGWTRDGKDLHNVALWQLLSRVLDDYKAKGIDVQFAHVPAHVGIHGNERADKLAKAAVRRAHANANLTPSQRLSRWVEDEADRIVAGITANLHA